MEKTGNPLLDIAITNKVKKYIDNEFETEIEKAKTYYLSFMLTLSQKGNIYSGLLHNLNLLACREV